MPDESPAGIRGLRRRVLRLALPLALALAAGAARCGKKPAKNANAAGDSTFVRAMVQLRLIAQDSSLDSAARDTARLRTLTALHLTPDSLERYARGVASDPDRASTLWHSIDDRMRDAAAKAPR